MVEIGKVYKHYKGNKYIVLNIGTHTETNEKLVVYSPINDRSIVWVRPYNMWNGIVDKDNKIKRFELDSNG